MSGNGRILRSVAVGGGHGLARTLGALQRLSDRVAAIVTVADDGGSSGRLRRDLGVLPPGDLRMALTALADDEDLAELVGYRFPRGELAGHSLGNLMLVALQELAGGDPVQALDRLAGLLGVPGRVLPCTPEPVILHASSRSGEIRGQAAVASTPRIHRVWLEPAAPPATPAALEELAGAELVVIGPGSLYTSLLPNLLVPDLAAALAATPALVVLIGNVSEQPGETEGMRLHDHLDALAEHVPVLRLDAVVVHDGPPPADRLVPLSPDHDALRARVPTVVGADLVDAAGGHDPARLAATLGRLLEGR